MKKLASLFCLALAIVLGTTQALAQHPKELQEVVDGVNSQCPIQMGAGIQLTSTELIGKSLQYNIFLAEECPFTLALFRDNAAEQRKAVIEGFALQKDHIRPLFELLQMTGYDLTYRYYDNKGTPVSFTMTSEELLAAINKEGSPHELLLATLKATQTQLPMQVDEITTMTRVDLDNDNVTYTFSVDMSDEDFAAFEELLASDGHKKGITDQLTATTVTKNFVGYCVADSKGIIYRYISKSSKSCSITLTVADLAIALTK